MIERRRELKLILDDRSLFRVLNKLCIDTTLRKQHPDRFVNSLYFDDLKMSSAADNLAGLSVRKKVRMRWYSQDDQPNLLFSNATLEIKSKKSQYSSKTTYSTTSINHENGFNYKNLTTELLNISNNNHLKFPALSPTMHVQYYRKYFIINSGIRVTVDSKIRFFDAIHRNTPQNTDFKKFDDNIVEIKFDPELSPHVTSILNDLGTSPVRNSKYLRGISLHGHIKYL